MLPRKTTKYIVVTSTMTEERIPVREIEYRARKYGYLDTGCHYVIEDGEVTACRPDHLIGVGVRPHNDSSIIITLSGSPEFTADQLSELGRLVEVLLYRYPEAQVRAHSDLPGAHTNAPGFDVASWWVGHNATLALGG